MDSTCSRSHVASTVKWFKAIGGLEERLPASAYWRMEWVALGEGKDWRKGLPPTHLEHWTPLLFALVYLSTFPIAIWSSAAFCSKVVFHQV